MYLSEKPISTKPLALDELAPVDREVCKALAGLGVVFDTANLIANEFNVLTLVQACVLLLIGHPHVGFHFHSHLGI